MNTELISKLKSLNPTEGIEKWKVDSWGDVNIDQDHRFNLTWVKPDDRGLILLAPSMREELLKMEEEMEKMRKLLLLLSSCNEEHEDYRSIAGLILKSRELLNQPQP